MQILRTPEEQFSNLPDYNFEPHYLKVPDDRYGALRMHYLDEGDSNAPVILLTPTQGSWVYIYRKLIPLLTAAGFRTLAPDYIGFGRSDKLPHTEDYSFHRHIGWLKSFLNQMNVQDATGFLFDWGGFFGLRLAAEEPHYFARLICLNTHLPTGDPSAGHEWFRNWRTEMLAMKSFPQGEMVNTGVTTPLSADEIAAYDAPYPDETFKNGPRRFPMILPIDLDDPARPANLAAWEQMSGWKKPLLTLFSKAFLGTAMGPERLINHVPGAKGQAHAGIPDTSFYLIEDATAELARRTTEFAFN
ncbi:MAG: alpha/beta fold hydrolase [Gammaproteobacteria bacterium]|nr:alpha/beta fold hydrolase [Gammaproteobacteria bacterium]